VNNSYQWKSTTLPTQLTEFVEFLLGPDGTFNPERLGAEISRLVEAGFETSSPDAEFNSIIAQTLRNMSEGSNDIQVS